MVVQDAEKSWHFDIFGFAEATEGNTLAVMTFYFMKRAGAFSKFGMHEAKLCRYLLNLESGYNPLPYHNRSFLSLVLSATELGNSYCLCGADWLPAAGINEPGIHFSAVCVIV